MTNSIFENIKHIDNEGNEYWYARELMKVLEYSEYRKFKPIISKAMNSCENSKQDIEYHFAHLDDMIIIGKGGKRNVENYKLSRYACYLIAQNGDPRKEVIALAQTYFSIQTRRMELLEEEYEKLSENEKRLYRRQITKDQNKILYGIARSKGVKNYDRFTNYGYKGLYNGETADDIAKRKNLRYREEILDNMGSAELGANIFRITQTEELLRKQLIQSEEEANDTHYRVGKAVRKTIKTLGGTMPEDQPTPKKSIKQIEKGNNNEINKDN